MSDRLSRDLWVLDAREQPDAVETYRKACAHLFDITLLSPEADFHNQLEGYQLGPVVFARCVGVPQRFERKLTHIMADPTDTVMAVLDLGKNVWRADYDGREASSDMGAIRLVRRKAQGDQPAEAFTADQSVGMVCRGHCFGNGLIMRAVGDRMIIAPPLTLTEQDIDELIRLIRQALDLTRQELLQKSLL